MRLSVHLSARSQRYAWLYAALNSISSASATGAVPVAAAIVAPSPPPSMLASRRASSISLSRQTSSSATSADRSSIAHGSVGGGIVHPGLVLTSLRSHPAPLDNLALPDLAAEALGYRAPPHAAPWADCAHAVSEAAPPTVAELQAAIRHCGDAASAAHLPLARFLYGVRKWLGPDGALPGALALLERFVQVATPETTTHGLRDRSPLLFRYLAGRLHGVVDARWPLLTRAEFDRLAAYVHLRRDGRTGALGDGAAAIRVLERWGPAAEPEAQVGAADLVAFLRALPPSAEPCRGRVLRDVERAFASGRIEQPTRLAVCALAGVEGPAYAAALPYLGVGPTA